MSEKEQSFPLLKEGDALYAEGNFGVLYRVVVDRVTCRTAFIKGLKVPRDIKSKHYIVMSTWCKICYHRATDDLQKRWKGQQILFYKQIKDMITR